MNFQISQSNGQFKTFRHPAQAFAFGLISLSFLCCSRSGSQLHTASGKNLLAALGSQAMATPGAARGEVDYVAHFRTTPEARQHITQVKARGGSVSLLEGSERNLRITALASRVKDLEVPPGAAVNANIPVKVKAAAEAGKESVADIQTLANSVLSSRRATGVDRLVARFPEADGRGVKVAIFDTGIDFGVQGLERGTDGSQKLLGFYDLTGFGQVTPTRLETDVPRETYRIGDKDYRFDSEAKPQKVQSFGIFDEDALSYNYLTPSIDMNQNAKGGDRFAYLVGVNSHGVPAVWLDANGDGIFNSATEELTDYNATHHFIDMRPEVAPSGARALAVTLRSPDDLQFHSVTGGHGTSCATIIAGDGYADGKLNGMAPKAKLLAYVLDVAGQDVYTMDQFMKMFLHAKAQGVDAISISWGFTTADLESARFFSQFLDDEIASSGIVIGIAAGNDGPGLSSEIADDYIPRLGFAVGALLSKDQATNTYGWSGFQDDTVVFYSGIGPTQGGRQIPDLVSPIATLVRGERGTKAPQFYAFSGTSSATPALIGSVSALISALKQHGEATIDARLLKLAVLHSTHPLTNVEPIRQGAGVIDVAAAHDVYLRLAKELRAARADTAKRTPFAYDLRPSVQLPNLPQKGDGVHLYGYQGTIDIALDFTKDSLALIDPLVTFEPLTLSHERRPGLRFLDLPAVLPLQAGGAKIVARVEPSIAAKPGVYTDVIEFKRPSDGLTLARVPVAIEIPARATGATPVIGGIDQELGDFDLVRRPFSLDRATAVSFDGLVREVTVGRGAALGIYIRSQTGRYVYQGRISLDRAVQPISFRTDSLPAGSYEMIFFRDYRRPAVINHLFVSGALRLPYASVEAREVQGNHAIYAIRVEDELNVTGASLKLEGVKARIALNSEQGVKGRAGFLGTIDFEHEVDHFSMGLRQGALKRTMAPFLNAETVVLDAATETPLYRGWIDFGPEGQPLTEVALASKTKKVLIFAYPNIYNGKDPGSARIEAQLAIPFEKPFTGEAVLPQPLSATPLALFGLDFDLGQAVPAGTYGTLELKISGADGISEKLPLR